MMDERRDGPMTEEELHRHIAQAVQHAHLYERDELTIENDRAIEYFLGKMRDVPSEEGRSQAVSKDVADTISWIMPQIMRVFTSTDKIANFEARTPNDLEAARQATEYINFLFVEECNGYRALYNAIHDGFLLRNGIIKHWWDDSPDFDVVSYSGLSEDQVASIVSSPDVEVLEYSEAEPEEGQEPDPMTGEPMPVMQPRFDMKIKAKVSNGKMCVEAVPPEEFLIERGCTSIDDARFMAHRRRRTRSDLIEEGYPQDLVDQIPTFSDWTYREEEASRHENRTFDLARSDLLDYASEYVDVFEAYAKLDFNGDGVAEWMRVILGGIGGESVILDYEEWDDDVPFTPIIPDPVPHRWLGRSMADEVIDIQQQKTVILRQMLDNIYLHNNPTPIIDRSVFDSPEAETAVTVLDGTPAKVFGTPSAAVTWYQVPFIGDKALSALEYLDQVREMRTGMSRVAMGMSQDVLQNQSATAVMQATSAAHSKLEMYARNISELGLKRLFRALYRLVVQHQDRPRIVRLRDRFVQIDPRPWAAEMDVTINVGLGTGSRDRDVAALQTMGAFIQNVIQTYGPDNPIAGMAQVRELGVKMAETFGLKNYETFIAGDDQAIQAWQQAQTQRPDPEAAKAQAEAQAKAQEAAIEAQMKQAEMQRDMQLKTAEMQQQAEIERQKMAQQAEIEREKIARQVEADRYKVDQEIQLKQYQVNEELALKREMARMDATVKAASVNVGGEPG